jgi:hypothetical protein
MRYVKVTGDGSGGSRFEDVDVPQTAAAYVENVPPLTERHIQRES